MARSKAKTATTPEATPPAAVEPPKRRRGRPEFVPTEEHHRLAELLLGMGLTQDEARQAIINPHSGKAIDKDTLTKHFAREVAAAEVMMHARAARSLAILIEGRPAQYDTEGKLLRAEIPINPASVMFYHKTRRGWSETQNVNHSGALEFTDAKSDLARRIARHAGADEPEEAGEAPRRTH